MASLSVNLASSVTSSVFAAESTPALGTLESAGAGITGGYTGDSLPLKIIIAFLLGLSLYNAIELIVLAFVTFQRYHGLYFWSLVISAFGIIPYSLGFIIKFFRLLDPAANAGYVGVVLLTLGWYPMITGQSVVLWSRLHLVTNSRRVLRWTLYMIIVNGVLLHSVTTVLTFGSNSNSLSDATLRRFVRGYSIMEKVQMVCFFVQETILSIVYIKETVRLLKLSETVQDDVRSFDDSAGNQSHGHLKNTNVRKTMYQLLTINVLIIAMDIALLSVEFANLYLIETTLKGVVYSIKLKLEFAVLGKLIQLVRVRAESDQSMNNAYARGNSFERRNTLTLEKTQSGTASVGASARLNGSLLTHDFGGSQYPDFVDPRRISPNVTHAEPANGETGWETRGQQVDQDKWRRRVRVKRGSWIDEEMDKHNIG